MSKYDASLAAEALALSSPGRPASASPSPPLPPLSPSSPPPWVLRNNNGTGAAAGRGVHGSSSRSSRLSTRRRSIASSGGFSGGGGGGLRRAGAVGAVRGWVADGGAAAAAWWAWLRGLARWALALYAGLGRVQRALVVAAGVLGLAAGVAVLAYSDRLFAALGPVAQRWHDLPGGWVISWLLVFVTGFPPVLGYTTACTLAGFVFGVGWGWPLVATANVAGSLAAFAACRGVLAPYVGRFVGADARFVALGHVLRRDGLWVLTAVRFCPLPYSLSNGFLATVPTVTPAAFAASTALASPKLLVHVFLGHSMARLVEDGDSMSRADKTVRYVSMAVFGAVGTTVGLLIYRRTMARAAEIAAEEEAAAAAEEGRGRGNDDDDDGLGLDSNAPLLDPDDADVAALMDDDDISLWAADPDDADASTLPAAAYHDDDDDDDGGSGGSGAAGRPNALSGRP